MKLILLSLLLTIIAGCAPFKKSIFIPEGVFIENTLIRTEPTEAMIYINGKEVGETPFRTSLTYSEGKLINIKAVPIYPNQFTQNIFMRVPPIPKTMTIYMNEKPSFLFELEEEKTIQPPEKRTSIVEVVHDTLYVDKISYYTTPSIYYEFDKAEIKASETSKLRELATFLRQNPEVYVDITGSADKRGEDEYNILLSLNRSKAVADYLVNYGVSRDRLFTRGIGRTTIYDDKVKQMSHQESRTAIFNLYVDKKDFEQMKQQYKENN